MSTARTRRLTGVLAVVLAAGTGVATTSGISSAHPRDKTLDVQILSFNDFHGNLEPPSGSSGRIVTDHTLDPATGKVDRRDHRRRRRGVPRHPPAQARGGSPQHA